MGSRHTQEHVPTQVPACELCGAARQFEFQVMRHLLRLIDVDSVQQSIDWATIVVYTCANSCYIDANAYALEYIYANRIMIDLYILYAMLCYMRCAVLINNEIDIPTLL